MVRILAFATMLIDHVGKVFFPDVIILHIIGRMAFPLFAWGIARGFRHTRNVYRYAARLLILAAISQVPYYLLFRFSYLNVCFTLLVGLATIMLYGLKHSVYIKWPLIITLLTFSHIIRLEYGVYGVLTILLFHIFAEDELVFIPQAIITLLYVVILRAEPMQLFSALSPILLLYIKEHDFKLNRYLQYGFYPGHLSVLLFITYIIHAK